MSSNTGMSGSGNAEGGVNDSLYIIIAAAVGGGLIVVLIIVLVVTYSIQSRRTQRRFMANTRQQQSMEYEEAMRRYHPNKMSLQQERIFRSGSELVLPQLEYGHTPHNGFGFQQGYAQAEHVLHKQNSKGFIDVQQPNYIMNRGRGFQGSVNYVTDGRYPSSSEMNTVRDWEATNGCVASSSQSALCHQQSFRQPSHYPQQEHQQHQQQYQQHQQQQQHQQYQQHEQQHQQQYHQQQQQQHQQYQQHEQQHQQQYHQHQQQQHQQYQQHEQQGPQQQKQHQQHQQQYQQHQQQQQQQQEEEQQPAPNAPQKTDGDAEPSVSRRNSRVMFIGEFEV